MRRAQVPRRLSRLAADGPLEVPSRMLAGSPPSGAARWNQAPRHAVRGARGWWLAVGALVISGLAYLLWTFLPAGIRPGDATLISDVAFLPSSLLVGLLAWRAAATPGISAATRRAWLWIGLAYLLFWGGDAIWFINEIVLHVMPSPSLADIAYLSYYPVLVIGLVTFPRVLRTPLERLRFALDCSTVVLGGTMIAWFLVIGPIASAAHADTLDALLSLAYPVGDLVLLLGVVVMALRTPIDVPRNAVALLVSGLAIFLTADVLYGVQSLDATYVGGGLVDALNVVAWTLTGVAAYLATRGLAVGREPQAGRSVRDGIPLVPYLAVFIGYAMLLTAIRSGWTPTIAGLVVGAGGLTALVMARQVVDVKENLRLVAEREGRRAEGRLHSLVLNGSDLILVADADWRIRYATPSVERTLGLTSVQLLGEAFEGLVDPEDRGIARALVGNVNGHGNRTPTYELRLMRRDGSSCSVEASILDLRDDPEMRGYVVTITDIDRRKRLEQKLARQAYHDVLTGLPTRPLFMGSVAHALTQARHADAEIGLIYVDIDDFAAVNNDFGRDEGDAVLAEAAHRIRRAIGPDLLLGRVGGDEFAILVEGLALPAADEMGQWILNDLRRPHALATGEASLRASIGLVATNAASTLPDDLLRTADAAMRLAKRDGKDRCVRMELAEFLDGRPAEGHESRRRRQAGSLGARLASSASATDRRNSAISDATLSGDSNATE